MCVDCSLLVISSVFRINYFMTVLYGIICSTIAQAIEKVRQRGINTALCNEVHDITLPIMYYNMCSYSQRKIHIYGRCQRLRIPCKIEYADRLHKYQTYACYVESFIRFCKRLKVYPKLTTNAYKVKTEIAFDHVC